MSQTRLRPSSRSEASSSSDPIPYIVDGEAMLEWAVMQDPFGNEFCIIRWPLDQT